MGFRLKKSVDEVGVHSNFFNTGEAPLLHDPKKSKKCMDQHNEKDAKVRAMLCVKLAHIDLKLENVTARMFILKNLIDNGDKQVIKLNIEELNKQYQSIASDMLKAMHSMELLNSKSNR